MVTTTVVVEGSGSDGAADNSSEVEMVITNPVATVLTFKHPSIDVASFSSDTVKPFVESLRFFNEVFFNHPDTTK